MKTEMIRKKVEAAGVPMAYILRAVGYRNAGTMWRQLEAGTISIGKAARLFRILGLSRQEINDISA